MDRWVIIRSAPRERESRGSLHTKPQTTPTSHEATHRPPTISSTLSSPTIGITTAPTPQLIAWEFTPLPLIAAHPKRTQKVGQKQYKTETKKMLSSNAHQCKIRLKRNAIVVTPSDSTVLEDCRLPEVKTRLGSRNLGQTDKY